MDTNQMAQFTVYTCVEKYSIAFKYLRQGDSRCVTSGNLFELSPYLSEPEEPLQPRATLAHARRRLADTIVIWARCS